MVAKCSNALLTVVLLLCAFTIQPAFSQEPPLYQIYNTIYGTSLASNQALENTYGLACSDTVDPCTQDGDCLTGTCDPIDDSFWLETNGYVSASARYAGYTQRFGYYTDACIGSEQYELFNVTTSGYLSGYDVMFLIGGGESLVGFFDDPSGSPQWFSQPSLNTPNLNDHIKTYRAPNFDPFAPEYVIAWEDLDLGDADYNDLVVVLEHLEPSPTVQCCTVDADCPDDGLFCNGEEVCVNHVCEPGDNPCPDDGLFCNGTEGCDEVSDICTQSGDPCAPDLMCDEAQDLCYEVTIDIGDGMGFLGSVNNPVEVSLDNPNDEVRSFQIDICDADNHLTCTECVATGRANLGGAICLVNELVNGCCRVLLHTMPPPVLDEGTGPVVIVKYDVSSSAPAGECRDLTPENAEVADRFSESLVVRTLPGEFCFNACTSDQDCDDGDVCTDDTCAGGVCQYANNTSSCDDGLNCTENDVCSDGVCIGTDRDCSGSGDQCNVGECDPATGECVQNPEPKNGLPCDDGLPCTVDGVCVDGTCVGSDKDCSALDDQCNVGVCDPDTGECMKDPEPKNGDPCDDTDSCTENDVCAGGTCAGTQIPGCLCDIEIALGRECPGEAIDDPAYNRPGRRGLAATCNDVIDFTVCSDCEPFDPSCLAWEIDPNPAGSTIAQIDDCCWRMTVGDICDSLDKIVTSVVSVTDTCHGGSESVEIDIGKVIVDIGDTTIQPNSESATVDINLINPDHAVRAFTMEVAACTADEDNLVCTQCLIDPDRALAFTCSASEQADGSCRIVMYATDPSAVIMQGRGPVARMVYSAGPEIEDLCGADACIDLCPINIRMSDQFNEQLCVCESPGEICFRTCADIYPQDCIGGTCGAPTCCGDGVIDLFDILEAADIVLRLQNPTCCQLANGDVPNGMPPYCGDPAGTPNCENTRANDGLGACVEDDPETPANEIAPFIDRLDIMDVVVMVDKALGKMNCCDYCLFGQIF